ncbi:DoxX family membrane protein [Chryseobacterium sp.]|mgnify:CR=1 FL=1|uniref:DoxX family membrane protein n=1 Tax=Chryseobacterium sp. TaxID=1871047 RepID=UPI0025C0B347|nr:DoxX family membrane protein [Chryseobacterium sp.]
MELSKKIMTGLSYVCRALLAYVFIPHGYEKLAARINPHEYIDFGLKGDFLDFYLIWERTNFIWVIGVAQLIGGLLLIFRRTYFLGAIWLLPLSVGMFCTHVFISHAMDFLYFDLIVLILNLYLIVENFKLIKEDLLRPQKTFI